MILFNITFSLIGPLCQILSYLSSIGLSLTFIGLKSYEFGSCVITNIGGIGIEDSFAPIPALTFAPVLLTLCKKTSKFYFDENGNVKEKKYLKFNLTSDYRFFEPKQASEIINEIHRIGENPEIFEEECKKCYEEGMKKNKKEEVNKN